MTPEVISISQPRNIIVDISTCLDRQYLIPFDPDTDVWNFFKSFTCLTLVKVWLYHCWTIKESFKFSMIYQFYIMVRNRLMSQIKFFLQFALLSKTEAKYCSNSPRPYFLHLFMKQSDTIKDYCKTIMIQVVTSLQGSYLIDRHRLITFPVNYTYESQWYVFNNGVCC